MGRVYERALTDIDAVSSEVITADSLGTESSVINRESSGNADGAQWYDVFAVVSSNQSSLGGNCILELYSAPYNPDNTDYADDNDDNYGEYSLTKKIPASDGSTTAFSVYVGRHYPESTREKFKFKAIDYGVTAKMVIIPMYLADS